MNQSNLLTQLNLSSVIGPGRISASLHAASQCLYREEFISNNGGWPFWRLKLIAIIALAIITGIHIYSSKLAIKLSGVLAVIKLLVLSAIAVAGFVKLPSVLREHPNNWSVGEKKGFEAYLYAFILVCNTMLCILL